VPKKFPKNLQSLFQTALAPRVISLIRDSIVDFILDIVGMLVFFCGKRLNLICQNFFFRVDPKSCNINKLVTWSVERDKSFSGGGGWGCFAVGNFFGCSYEIWGNNLFLNIPK